MLTCNHPRWTSHVRAKRVMPQTETRETSLETRSAVAIKMPPSEDIQKAAERQQLEKNRAAVQKLQDEIKAGADDGSSWYSLGVALLNIGEFASARDSLMNAVERDKNLLHAWTNLAVAHYELGEYQEAAVISKRAMEVRAGFMPARVNLAMASLKLGNFAEAETQFRAVLQVENEMPMALAGMKMALEGLGRMEDAVHYRLRAMQAGVQFADDE